MRFLGGNSILGNEWCKCVREGRHNVDTYVPKLIYAWIAIVVLSPNCNSSINYEHDLMRCLVSTFCRTLIKGGSSRGALYIIRCRRWIVVLLTLFIVIFRIHIAALYNPIKVCWHLKNMTPGCVLNTSSGVILLIFARISHLASRPNRTMCVWSKDPRGCLSHGI